MQEFIEITPIDILLKHSKHAVLSLSNFKALDPSKPKVNPIQDK